MQSENLATAVVDFGARKIERQRNTLVEDAREVFRAQADAITQLSDRINGEYTHAVEIMLATKGKVIISGMGKSGLIGKKMAATFASTGTPSFFVHPGEAYHGDLGMITEQDSVILISNSGETEEVIRLIPYLKQVGIPIISFVGNVDSTLALHSDTALDISVEREVCPNNLAPTNSTLVTMAMGDALAVTLIKERDFKPFDFAQFHPGGSLGRRLLTRVKDAMHTGEMPMVDPEMTVQDSLMTITQGRLGLALVMDGNELCGIVTDGDLRRALQKHSNLQDVPVTEIMNPEPQTIYENQMLVDAEDRMKRAKIKALVVLDDHGIVTGILEIFND